MDSIEFIKQPRINGVFLIFPVHRYQDVTLPKGVFQGRHRRPDASSGPASSGPPQDEPELQAQNLASSTASDTSLGDSASGSDTPPSLHVLDTTSPIKGDFVLTSHHFLFSSPEFVMEMMYTGIQAVKVHAQADGSAVLELHTRDMQVYRFRFPIASTAANTLYAIENLRCPASHTSLLPFVVPAELDEPEQTQSWNVYVAEEEWKRLQVLTDKTRGYERWRVSEVNKNFRICQSYPEKLIVPQQIEDMVLEAVAKHRLKGRIPVLTYWHKEKKVALVRSSAPSKAGKRLYDDEQLLRHFRDSCDNAPGVLVDTRNVSVTKTGAVELMDHYHGWKREFADLPSPSAVQDSFIKFRDVCMKGNMDASDFISKVESSGWPTVVQRAMTAGTVIANLMSHRGKTVLVRGSYGWDHTSVICSLAQVIMDRHFRTIKGFIILIEKEWLHMGHPFTARCGHFGSKKTHDLAPTFLLFLECVWQVMQQFPMAFEFNHLFLEDLHAHSQWSRHGNFLFNAARERRMAGVTKTSSLWAVYLRDTPERTRILNPVSNPKEHKKTLPVSFRPQIIGLWRSLYCKVVHHPDVDTINIVMLDELMKRRKQWCSEAAKKMAELDKLRGNTKSDYGKGKPN